MKRMGYIYKIENIENGKVYIGQTIHKPVYRINKHFSELERQVHNNDYLQRAYNKYGKKAFKPIVLECVNINVLDNRERYWIKYHRETTGAYNLEGGGNKLKVHSAYSRNKMSIASKKAFKRPDVIAKMKVNAENMRGKGNPRARKIVCLNTTEVFDTITMASEKYGITTGDIWSVCNGERRSVGFHKTGIALQFEYYNKRKNYIAKEVDVVWQKRRVVCTNTKEVFETATKASEVTGIPQSGISQCCNGNRKYAGEMPNGDYIVWVFEEDYDKFKDYSFKGYFGAESPIAKKVVCVNTGKIYDFMCGASRDMNVQQSHISQCCNGKRNFAGRMPNGDWIKWLFLEDYDKDKTYSFKRTKVHSKEAIRKMSESQKLLTPKISNILARDIVSGEEIRFSRVSEALEYLRKNVNEKACPSPIYRSLKNKLATAYGYEWSRT